jgi:acetyl/propionyl-CoA carboxylase alpha subunit
MNIQSILIANRGEIAIRIIKTARRMGLRTWCFQTPQEANACYISFADEIICIPENSSAIPVFLNVEAIIGYAKENHIESIHPGYGFLAENPELARRCTEEGILFIGPSEASIRQMGDKNEAKKMAVEVGIPVIKGSNLSITSLAEATRQSFDIGYPVMLKALAGGGGKGMRVVRDVRELEQSYNMTVNEALNAFNNGAMLIEKYIERPRHIEVQVLADHFGNAVHLFERECSVQRNHQKLLEEAPSIALTDSLRTAMTDCALKLCRAANYYTLGTVEFLLDDQDNFYFLEMNTRIQVEHPVTEAITGLDLVELQIRTASGEKLLLKQDNIQINGWAFEFRVNAEDVQANFAPNFGIIDEMIFPVSPHLRIDSGFTAGSVMPALYDSLVAKMIVTGKTRDEAIRHALAVLKKTRISGIKTTIPFIKATLNDPDFVAGTFDTSFVSSLKQLYHQEKNEERAAAMIALQAYLENMEKIESNCIESSGATPWITRMWNKII